MDEGQRSVWFAEHAALTAELTGQVRRRRSWRQWWPSGLVLVVVLGLYGLSWVTFDASVGIRPLVGRGVITGLWVLTLALGVMGFVSTSRSGNLGAGRYSPNGTLTAAQRARVLALLARADQADPDQAAAGSELARRVLVQRGQSWFNAGFVLLMAALVLGDQDIWFALAGGIVAVAHLFLLITRERDVQRARRFRQAYGQPVPVPAR